VENLLPRGVLGTPRRAIIAGVVALVLAIVLLLVYLDHYRNSVKSSNANVSVLVATKFISKGTLAVTLAKEGRFAPASIPKDQLQTDAVTDAAALQGQVALADVFPGQQLTIADFGTSPTASALSGVLNGPWRAMSIPLDQAHGISPQTQTNDRVDVYLQLGGVLGLLMPNVLVLAAPNQVPAGTTAPVSNTYILRVPSSMAARFAYASENGKIWFALRGQHGVPPVKPVFVTGTNVFVLGGR
jgi:Flp pilus assembly protein CpaB